MNPRDLLDGMTSNNVIDLFGEVMMHHATSLLFDGGKLDELFDRYEQQYGGTSEHEIDMVSAILMLTIASVVDGVKAGYSMMNDMQEAYDEGKRVGVIAPFVEKMVDAAIELVLGLPDATEIPDFYKPSERKTAIINIDGNQLTNEDLCKLSKALGVNESAIKAGKIVFGSKADCDELVETIKGKYENCMEDNNYTPSNSVNDMLEAACAAKANS